MSQSSSRAEPSSGPTLASPKGLLVIVGPTASGKSALAARMGARLGGEVISADSVQVYRHFDIGAGKPNQQELSLCPHHLINIREPHEVLEASAWAQLASEQVDRLLAQGGTPVICGGSFLWVRALLFGLALAPPGSEQIRVRHRQMEQELGRAHLHSLLTQVDPKSAARLHENDFVRVSRALEVHELSGRPLSELQADHGFKTPRYRAQLLAVEWPRELYEERLSSRVIGMLEAGLVDEVRGLLAAGYAQSRAMASVGYRQVYESLTQELSSPQEQLCQKIIQVTRIFARRQRTWLRDQAIQWVRHEALFDDDVLDSEIIRLGLRG